MTHKDFDELVDYIVTERIKGVMCRKSVEYARGGDKLYNFKRAAEISGKTPLECLQGMKLKHDVSILDMLDDEKIGGCLYPLEKWEEKIGDDINYLILMLALLYEKHGWIIPKTETEPDQKGSVKRYCWNCVYSETNAFDEPCHNCSWHSKWELER